MGAGAASKVIASCLHKGHTPLIGAALFAEYKACHLSKEERNELLGIFLAYCRWTAIYYGWRPNLKDEGDNHLIELAAAVLGEILWITPLALPFSKGGEQLR